jgi:hypothetical protein
VGEWDLIAATSGGLAKDATYWVSQASPGHLTSTPPTSAEFAVPVGIAISRDTLLLMLAFPALVP